MYEAGMSTPAIAKEVGVSARSVYVALQRMGVKFRSISDAVSLSKRGRKHMSNGYWRVSHAKGMRTPEHILIAEAALGRKLRRNEVVHHINRNRADNRKENLLICTRSYHTALHSRMDAHPYWSTLETRHGR